MEFIHFNHISYLFEIGMSLLLVFGCMCECVDTLRVQKYNFLMLAFSLMHKSQYLLSIYVHISIVDKYIDKSTEAAVLCLANNK